MINEILFVVLFSILSLLTGHTILVLTHSESDLFSDFSWGITALFAVFHILAYPLFISRAEFTILLYAYGAIIVLITAVSVTLLLRSCNSIYKKNKFILTEFAGYMKKYPLLTLIAFVFVALEIYTCIFCYHPSNDDGYYLTRSMEVINSNSLDIHPSLSWYGEKIYNYSDLTDASTLAFFISCFSYIFRLSPTILCRRGFALIMILAHISSLITVLKKLSGWKGNELYRKTVFCVILYSFFQFKAEKVCSAGRWLTDYIWQGKAILIALIFPMLLCACSELIKEVISEKELHGKWLLAGITLTAGISVSTVGLFLPAILFFSYGAAFLISTKFRYTKKVILPAIAVLIPVIICAAISYFTIATENTRYFEIGKSAQWSWKQQFLRANDIFQILLYVAGSIYLIFSKKNFLQKILLIFSSIILFATFMNPLFAKPVSTYVTSAEVYWRLFWILPVYLVPAIAITEAADAILNGELQSGALCVSAVLVILWGFASQNYYIVNPKLSFFSDFLNISDTRRENPYGISEISFDIANAVINNHSGTDRPKLLTKYDENFEIRQFSSEIITFWSGQNELIPGFEITQSEFIQNYDNYADLSFIYNAAKALKADYICIKNISDEIDVTDYNFEKIISTNGIDLLKINY